MKHGTMKVLCVMSFFWIGLPLPAAAAEAAVAAESAPAAAGSQENAKIAVGTRTARWLDIQREGRAAGNLLPIPGAEAGPSYQRYIDSFASPIPDKLPSSAPASGAQR